MGNHLTAQQQQQAFQNLAAADTTYNIKAGLVLPGQRLQYQRDVAVAQGDPVNSTPLNVATPEGYTIIDCFKAY